MSEFGSVLDRASKILPGTEIEFAHLRRRRDRKRRTKRVTAGIVALVVAASGSVAAFALLRTQEPATPAAPPDDFAALWPEDSFWSVVDAQAQADAGALDWRLDPTETARRFAGEALLWPDALIMDCPIADLPCLPQRGPSYIKYIHVPDEGLVFKVWLQQPLRAGTRGVWSVVKVTGGGLDIRREPRQELRVPALLTVWSTLPNQAHVTVGYDWWQVASDSHCGSGDHRPRSARRAGFQFQIGPVDLECSSDGGGIHLEGGVSVDGTGTIVTDSGPVGSLTKPAYGLVSAVRFQDGTASWSVFGGPPELYAENRGTSPITAIAAVAVRFVPREQASPRPTPSGQTVPVTEGLARAVAQSFMQERIKGRRSGQPHLFMADEASDTIIDGTGEFGTYETGFDPQLWPPDPADEQFWTGFRVRSVTSAGDDQFEVVIHIDRCTEPAGSPVAGICEVISETLTIGRGPGEDPMSPPRVRSGVRGSLDGLVAGDVRDLAQAFGMLRELGEAERFLTEESRTAYESRRLTLYGPETAPLRLERVGEPEPLTAGTFRIEILLSREGEPDPIRELLTVGPGEDLEGNAQTGLILDAIPG